MKNGILFLALCFLNFQYVFCQECISINHSELAKGINDFRQSNDRQILKLSFAVCKMADIQAKSLQENGQKVQLSANLFKSSEKMIKLKVRDIDANSKNTISTFTMKHPAIDFWKVILEAESFSNKNWKSFGVGLYKNYAVLWFTDKDLNDKPSICGNQTINTQTEIVIAPKKELPFIKNGKWLIEPTYYKMKPLQSEPELFPVANDTDKWGYITKNGEVLIPFKYKNAYGFSEGLAAVKTEGGKYGYINTAGEFEISPKYNYGAPFSNGIAIVNHNSYNYLINFFGEEISGKNTDIGKLSNKYLAFKKGGLYEIKDISGKVVKQAFFSDFFAFSEGLAGVKVQGKWGFMDESFKIVIAPKYTEKLVYAFKNGLARFKQNGKVGVIDKSGKVIFNLEYEDLYEFSEGLAAFSQNRKWGYINLSGKVVISPQYLNAFNFKYGMAKVVDSKLKCHLIDQNNIPIITDVYDIIIFSKKLIGVKAKKGWGLVQLNR